METKKPRVVIAGAGPGDPELISLKALKAIKCADVILYDALIDQSLLSHAALSCKLVFVGKRKGHKEFSQDEINDLIVYYSCRNEYVLRLKGGDPYVFGRGHEEVEHLLRRGIDVEVIPGISSAIAAPSAVGIPLTKRGVNESFWVITGMLSNGKFSSDLRLAAQSSATVVILMGMSHLESIMKLFVTSRSTDEPVAVIQNACTTSQVAIVSTASQISTDIKDRNIASPAVIIVGKVVNEGHVSEILLREEVKLKVAV